MKAYVYDRDAGRATLTDHPDPSPGGGEVLLAVEACGLCRTDLHILDGDLRPRRPRVVLGHQVVGRVIGAGEGAEGPCCARA
jgi:propanol-preferring alcohol dehydrogenase